MFSIFPQKVGFCLKYQWSNKPQLIFLKIYSFGTKKQENILQLPKSTKFSNLVIEHLFTVTDGHRKSSGCWWKLLQKKKKKLVYVKRFVRSHNGINHMNDWKYLDSQKKHMYFGCPFRHEIGNFRLV